MKNFKQYSIPFSYLRKNYTGHIQEMQPADKKMIRASVEIGEEHPQVFIFYPQAKDELFWYDLADDWKQAMAWKVAYALLDR